MFDELESLGAAVRSAGNTLLRSVLNVCIKTYNATVQFCRWLGLFVSKLYFTCADVLGDLIYAARVFYPLIASILMYWFFRWPFALFLSIGYAALIVVALLFFKERSEKTVVPRPDWATFAGHAAILGTGLFTLLAFTIPNVSRTITADNQTGAITKPEDEIKTTERSVSQDTSKPIEVNSTVNHNTHNPLIDNAPNNTIFRLDRIESDGINSLVLEIESAESKSDLRDSDIMTLQTRTLLVHNRLNIYLRGTVKTARLLINEGAVNQTDGIFTFAKSVNMLNDFMSKHTGNYAESLTLSELKVFATLTKAAINNANSLRMTKKFAVTSKGTDIESYLLIAGD